MTDPRNDSSNAPANPWSLTVQVAQIPEAGLHQDITANAEQRAAIAALGGLRAVASASASFDLVPVSNNRVKVTGRIRANVGQTCVVSLDPIDNEIDETIDLVFAPPSQIPEMADLVVDDLPPGVEPPDPPEPIERGMIDLGRVATDALFLALDPYPRKPDAVFDLPVEPDDPDEHPFAALKALKTPAPPAKPKPRRDR
jgi:uncharacterized metal-binding protein YceD (DUF177 family)